MTAGLNWGDPSDSLTFTIIPDAILDPYHDADEERICHLIPEDVASDKWNFGNNENTKASRRHYIRSELT